MVNVINTIQQTHINRVWLNKLLSGWTCQLLTDNVNPRHKQLRCLIDTKASIKAEYIPHMLW